MNKRWFEIATLGIFLSVMVALIIVGAVALKKFDAWDPLETYHAVQMQDKDFTTETEVAK